MDKSIIKMTYQVEKEDGVLSHDVDGEFDKNYTKLIDTLYELIGTRKGLDIEQVVGDLLSAYEERAYIEGFKNGFNLNNEIKAIN